MFQFEDASELAQSAVNSLLSNKEQLQLPDLQIQSLTEFTAAQQHCLETAERELICDQAMLIIDQFYPHLPFKRARYAIDPVQRVRLLRARLDQLDNERQFHSELIATFAEMRDVHTSYRRPPPYAGSIAVLPFLVQFYGDEEHKRRFLVTNLLDAFDHPTFRRGIEITHWNGVPIERAVELLAEHIPGGNPSARFMRGMMRLTVRSLASTLPPDEEIVFVRYRAETAYPSTSSADHIIAIPWHVCRGFRNAPLAELTVGATGPLTAVCEPLQDLATVRRALWTHKSGDSPDCEESSEAHEVLGSALPDVFRFQHSNGGFDASQGTVNPALLCDASGKRFGCIRIKSFEGDPDDIFAEFDRILGIMQTEAPDGLILDVRGNAGGSIRAAERLLQTLTPKQIFPAKFHFANTPVVQSIMAQLQQMVRDPNASSLLEHIIPLFRDWFSDALEAVASGNLLTSGRPITDVRDANDTGQRYYGPVTLLIDAASYSATDTFAAGFQDHGIGEIIGVDENTGGGGATLWKHSEDLVKRFKGLVNVQPSLELLPAGVSMTIALQRSARVGLNAGDAVEDVGVRCDVFRPLTRTDLLNGSSELISFACSRLALRPAYRLKIVSCVATEDGLDIQVETSGIDRLVSSLDSHPQAVVDGSTGRFHVPFAGFDKKTIRELRIDGYSWFDSVADGKTLRLTASARNRVELNAT